MKRAEVRIGGGCKGRLIYYGYMVCGCLSLSGFGFNFLKRKDRTGLTPTLYGLRDALRRVFENAEGLSKLIIYSIDNRLTNLLTTSSPSIRDRIILDLVHEIEDLARRIRGIEIVESNETFIEEWLRKNALRNFNQTINRILEGSKQIRNGETIIYVLDESSIDIPLEYLSCLVLKKEKQAMEAVIIKSNNKATILHHHSIEGSKNTINILKTFDNRIKYEKYGRYRTIYITETPANQIIKLLENTDGDYSEKKLLKRLPEKHQTIHENYGGR